MKKTIRIISVIAIAFFALALATLGLSAKVNAADIDFEQGAYVRVDTSEGGYSGLRFVATINKEGLKGQLFNEDGSYKTNCRVSMLIAPEKAFEAFSTRTSEEGSNYLEFFKIRYGFEREQISADIPAANILDYTVKGVLKVKEANYGVRYQAVLYYTTDGGATYAFSDKSAARSISCVASAAESGGALPEGIADRVATFVNGDEGATSHQFENGVCTVCGTTLTVVEEGRGAAINLNVSYADLKKPVAEQTTSFIDKDQKIDLGKDYGTLRNATYDGVKNTGITLAGNYVTLPQNLFSPQTAGEHELTLRTSQGVVSVPIYVATRVIADTSDFNKTFRSLTKGERAYGYFVLGNDLDYGGANLGGSATVTCNGLCGTFNGRGYAIKNLDTGHRDGLFSSIHATNKTVIKNLVFTDLVHSGNVKANIFGYLVAGTTFENITINVKSSVVAEGSAMPPASDYYGFLTGYTMDRCTFKNVTINAEGQEIFCLFGYWTRRPNDEGPYYTCENVVVNAKKVHYLGRDWVDNVISGDTKVAGLTINQEIVKEEIAQDLYETGTTSYLVDLGVADTKPNPNYQTVGSGNAAISVGTTYGDFVSLTYNGNAVEGAAYADGVLTFPVNIFAATDRGTEKTVVLKTTTKTANYTLTVHLFVATRVIKTTAEFEEVFRVIAASKFICGYFVLGADLDYAGNALPAPGGTVGDLSKMNGLMGTFDGRGHSIKNFNTGNAYGLFPIIKYNDKSYIKNLVFENLVHTGNKNSTIFASSMQGITLENIVINVAQSSIPAGATMGWGHGLFASSYITKSWINNVTVNAEGQEIFSLIAPMLGSGKEATSCDKVIVNAKKVQYIGSTDAKPENALTAYSGVTINQDAVKEEITQDLYETGTTSYLVDLGVTDVEKATSDQTTAETAALNIGTTYGDLVSLTYNESAVEGATYAEGVLTFPLGSVLNAAIAGQEGTLVMKSSSNTANYTLNIHALFATKVIKTTTDFETTFRKPQERKAVYGYFVLGNDLDYAGTPLKNPGTSGYSVVQYINNYETGFAGTFDGRGHSIKNFETENAFGLFVKTIYSSRATIKNLVFDDLVHSGKPQANIFGHTIAGVVFDNITINVKSSVVAEGSTMTPADYSKDYYGFLTSYTMDKCSFKDVTINAEGQEIFSLFGYWIKQTANIIDCDNVIVNAKKIHYLGRDWNNPLIDASTVVAGLTINLPVSRLVEDGASTYSVVVPQRNPEGEGNNILPAYGMAIGASNELQTFAEKAIGKKFGWFSEGTTTSDNYSGKFISIGGTSRLSAAIGTIPDLNENEYFIKTIDGNVYIAGGDSTGLIYGVYDFLKTHFNFEYFADGVYYIDTNVSNCNLNNYKGEIVSPSFTYRLPAYGFETKSDMDTNYSYRMKFNSTGGQLVGADGVGGSLHNFFSTIPYSTYSSNYSNWFYRYRKYSFNSYEYRQLCFSRDLNGLAAEVASKIKTVLSGNANAKYIVFGQEDNDYWCDCSSCTSYINSRGGFKASTYIRFMNKVSDLIADYLTQNNREAYLVMFAYHATQDAPVSGSAGNYSLVNADMQLRDNVCVMYAPIEANYYVSFNDSVNADVKKNIEGWSLVSKNVFYWFYMENFAYYLDFFDNFGSIKENLQFAAEHNGLYLFNNAQYNQVESTCFSHLKAYLNAKLMYNVNEDTDKLTNDFFAHYYGAAGDVMKNIYTEIRAMFATKYANDRTIGYLSTKAHKCSKADYDLDKLAKWLDDIDSAYAAIAPLESSDPVEYARIAKAIKVESMAVRYWTLYYYPEEYRAYKPGVSIVAMRQAWKDDAKALGITLWGEHKSIDDLYKESWTGLN